jgi:deoxyadenosine/deoxycytidine kinase
MHIAIAGNIGSGKTTLTRLLAKHFKWNPIMKMLSTIPTWMILPSNGTLVFNLQIYFLNSRFRQVMQIRESGKKSYKNHL